MSRLSEIYSIEKKQITLIIQMDIMLIRYFLRFVLFVCRCGICISGGDKNNCPPSECSECSTAKLYLFYFIIFVSIPCTVYMVLFLTMFILHIVKPRYRRTLLNVFHLRRFTNWTGFFVASGLVFLLVIYGCFSFRDVARIVSMQMMEEMNPSDHLMIVARLNLAWKTADDT